jgi:hypothetical protein
MKRIILLATVAALMAVMSVVGAPGAFAHEAACTGKGLVTSNSAYAYADTDQDGYVCVYAGKHKTRVTDDHGVLGH